MENKPDKVAMHAEICTYLTDLYRRKNKDYGDSFTELRQEFPDSILLRLKDKYNRLETLCKVGATTEVGDERIEDTFLDMSNYCIMEDIERRIEGSNTKEVECALLNLANWCICEVIERRSVDGDVRITDMQELKQLLDKVSFEIKNHTNSIHISEFELTKKQLKEVSEELNSYKERCHLQCQKIYLN